MWASLSQVEERHFGSVFFVDGRIPYFCSDSSFLFVVWRSFLTRVGGEVTLASTRSLSSPILGDDYLWLSLRCFLIFFAIAVLSAVVQQRAYIFLSPRVWAYARQESSDPRMRNCLVLWTCNFHFLFAAHF
jgi:hypothetical protein